MTLARKGTSAEGLPLTDATRRKLKRHRLAREPEGSAPALLTMDPGGRTELCRPSAQSPALRRYVPREAAQVEAELRRLGVLDWRGESGPGDGPQAVSDAIICGDARQALSHLPESAVTCVITSPPYWNVVDYGLPGQLGACGYEEYLAELMEVWRECERVLQPNGKLCIITPIVPVPKAVLGHQHTRHLKNLSQDIEAGILRATALERFSLYVWQKQTTEKMFGSYPYPPNLFEQNTVEFISVLVKGGRPKILPRAVKERSRLDEKQWMDLTRQVWQLYPQDVRRASHPAPFPEALPNRLIAMYTFAAAPEEGFGGDLVLDPFCGTGATCAAAKKLGRRFLGIDLSADFAVQAAERVLAAQPDGRIALHTRGGHAR